MGLITEQITARHFELIRDRIGVILTLELAGQTFTNALNMTGWSERRIPFEPQELPAWNVQYDTTTFDSKHTTFKSGENKYFIDIHTAKPSTSSGGGDVLASKELQRIAGIIDYILEHPVYCVLGFDPGFISTTMVEQFEIGGMQSQDNEHNLQFRIHFKVVASEETTNITPASVLGIDTQVKLDLTDLGHKYTLNNK